MRYLLIAAAVVFPLIFHGCSKQSVPTQTSDTIGGTVVNLAGNDEGLILQDNGGDNLPINANGNFQFPTAVESGNKYQVTVFTQPSNPAQTCSVTNGTGVATADVTNVKVDCGHNEWMWATGTQLINQAGVYGTLGTPAAANTPGGRQLPAIWTDQSGNLWLFGGYGYDLSGNLLPMSDLWKFSAGQWTWMGGPTLGGQDGVYGTLGMAAPDNIPGARFEASTWTDSSGDSWLFGGNGFDSVGNESPMNDLWKYSGGQWTWMGGSRVGLQQGVYGTLGVADPSNMPGGRAGAALWVDASGNVWIFGGLGYDESNPINGELGDLWKYSNGEWTWMGGPEVKQQAGVYGTQGTASASNSPGGRWGAFAWVDSSGNFWLFGGYGMDASGNDWLLNDQWKYSSGQWTWVAGAKVINQPGVYGTQGASSPDNIPGSRFFGVQWSDSSGNVWLFGGNGFDSTGHGGWLNDLWRFNGSQWTWVSGSALASPQSTYGTQGVLAPGNAPGGRFFLSNWKDKDGNLWLFGGYGESSTGTGNLNDCWMYMP